MNQQIVGAVVGLEQRNQGWVAVAIHDPSKQYPTKLSTKRQELIAQAQQMMGQVVTAGYNEEQSTSINPHNGQPYTNRYLEALAFGAVDLVGVPTQIQPQQQMPQPQFVPQPQPQAQNFPQPQPVQQQPIMQPQTQQPLIPQPVLDQREQKIHRQTATKVAAALLPLLSPENHNLAALVRISEQLVQYYDNGVQWTTPAVQPQASVYPDTSPPQPQAQQQHQQGYENPGEYAGDPGPQGIPPQDDDIPFGPAIW